MTILIVRKNWPRRIVLVPLTACQGMLGVRVLQPVAIDCRPKAPVVLIIERAAQGPKNQWHSVFAVAFFCALFQPNHLLNFADAADIKGKVLGTTCRFRPMLSTIFKQLASLGAPGK